MIPMIAEMLDDIQKDYPEGWFVDAVREAKKSTTRISLRYVEAILKRWKAEGLRDQRKNSKRPLPETVKIYLPDGSIGEAKV